MRFGKTCGAFVFLLLAVASVARGYEGGRNQFEAVLGWYYPSDINFDGPVVTPHGAESGVTLEYKNGFTWGARYGYRFSDAAGTSVTWTHLDLDSNASASNNVGCSNCDADIDFADFSFDWYPGGHDWSLYAGLGWASGDFEVNLTGDSNDRSIHDDAFTWHLGTAWTWHIGESFYLRPDARVRFLQLDQNTRGKYDSEDPEFRLGFGWQF